MRSHACLRVARDRDGVTRAVEVRGEVPQLLRVTHAPATPDDALTVHLVGGGAGPLGGDRFRLQVTVEDGARLQVRSTGATLALPGRQGAPSLASVEVSVGADASLDWWPEPLVACTGCRHRVTTALVAHESASWRWVDEVVLGRDAEAPGQILLEQRVTSGGRTVWRQDLDAGPHTAGPGRTGPNRVVVGALAAGSFLAAGRATPAVVTPGWRGAAMDLEGGARHWSVLAGTHTAAREALHHLLIDVSAAEVGAG